MTQEAHAAREIARSDARPIASDIADIEGHAPREAAHLSSPPALNRFEVVEQIARAARAPLRAGHTELTVRLESWGAGAAA
ncbi:MAG: hypothetical protein JSV65_16940 [Armatimonadota bacterium]|nr:MAG: hypothetical protein JSV65_16940 [Armatimonadota bacterium]